LLTLVAASLGPGASPASAVAPTVGPAWTYSIFSTSAWLGAEVDRNGLATTYHFDYILKSAYEANLAASRDGFSGGSRKPLFDVKTGSGSGFETVTQQLSLLAPGTAYSYRLVATNVDGTTPGSAHTFVTRSINNGGLPDNRGYEMVSPVDKNGGQVEPPGALAGGGVLQAAAQGSSVTYGSAASFGVGGQGAATASQYVSSRTSDGWSTQNITAPLYSGSYGTGDEGVPFQLFTADLSRGLLLNGHHCRGDATGCAVPNPPLAGTDAPAGYQNYYLWQSGGAFDALLGASDVAALDIEPAYFDLRFAGASPDLAHVVLSSCAALTADATEVAAGSGCDPAQQNLYEWSAGAGLGLVNLKPGDTTGTPGAALAAQSGAVSSTGARVYFTLEGNLYLREGATTRQVDEGQGGGGEFQAASADGAVAFFTKEVSVGDVHLFRYLAGGAATDITPSGGVAGVLGVAAAGDYAYYQDASALRLWHNGTTTTVASGAEAAQASDWPPTTGTARISADGTHLLFVSSAYELTGYDNTDLASPALCGEPSGICDSEVYLYDTGAGLTCLSCNPTNERPVGPSSIPGAIANGTAPLSTDSYKPRVLSADGRRVFFDSYDALALSDTNSSQDAYQWEAQGMGSCNVAGGCVSLISSGRSAGVNSFIDASADGADAFFLTEGSLVSQDPGALDLYDARVGGGFPESSPPISCEGDACQPLPSAPTDPTLTTLLAGPGNPPLRFVNQAKHCRRGFVKRHGKCVRKKKRAKKRSAGHRRRSRR
jgi:hypothetical protein